MAEEPSELTEAQQAKLAAKQFKPSPQARQGPQGQEAGA